METMLVKPERKAQLEQYAHRHGKDTNEALDDVLEIYFEWERRDYEDAVEAIGRGLESVEAGRTRPASEFLEELREKHGFPR